MNFCLENHIPVISHKFIEIDQKFETMVKSEQEKIGKLNSEFKGGFAQLMNDYEFPWKMLCIGYGSSAKT